MSVTWSTVTGQMVGTNAPLQHCIYYVIRVKFSYCLIVLIVDSLSLSEVWRERVFLYGCKFGRESELFEAGNDYGPKLWSVLLRRSVSCVHRLCYQGVNLMDEAALHQQAQKKWNPAGEVKLSSWLQQEHSEQDKERLKTIGNVVFPAVARTAMHIIGSQVMSRKARC